MTELARHNIAPEAALESLVRALRGPAILTCADLADRVHAERWHDGAFEAALEHGVATGRLVRLSEELVEIGA